MPALPRIAIDARKAGDTGVGRYLEALVAGLVATPSSAAFGWLLVSHAHRWSRLRRLPPGAMRLAMRASVYSPYQHLEWWRLLRTQPVHLLHVPHFTAPWLIPRRTHLIVTIHDAAFLERPDLLPAEQRVPWRRAAYRLALALAARQADVVCADTNAAARSLAQCLPGVTPKLRVLTPAVVPFHTPPEPGGERDVIIFTGTVTARKGVHELILAYRRSRACREGLRLVLIGPDDSQYAWTARALVHRLCLDDRVLFTGYVADEALGYWYARARAAVLPSYLEGFGYPVAEAMQAGVPCVATAIPAIAEVAQDAALLVPPGDLAALAAALDRACFEQDLRMELVARGRARAAAFSIERMGQAALDLYCQTLYGLLRI